MIWQNRQELGTSMGHLVRSLWWADRLASKGCYFIIGTCLYWLEMIWSLLDMTIRLVNSVPWEAHIGVMMSDRWDMVSCLTDTMMTILVWKVLHSSMNISVRGFWLSHRWPDMVTTEWQVVYFYECELIWYVSYMGLVMHIGWNSLRRKIL